ncbi:MAG: methylmalonyl-CoA mutase family protein [Candidatus Jordarchaeaceae archaeon]
MFDEKAIKEIEERKKLWEKQAKQCKERDVEFTTYSGIPVKELYTPADIKNHDYLRDVGFPGEPPYTRGVYLNMYRGRLWTMRLFSGYGTPEETNQRWKLLYEAGETGFSAAVDVLTFNGLDPDDPRATAEVGTSGVPLYCIDSMYALTEGLPIDKISVALVVEPFTSAPICAMYFNMAKSKGIDLNNLMGTCQNDICTMSLGFVPFENVAPRHLLRLACDLIEYTAAQKNVPKWHPINFTTYNYREGGIDAIQELGIGFANAMAHIDEVINRGYNIDDFVGRLAFHLSAHKDFFEEIAKFRAARRIWAKEMKKRGATNPRSMMLRFHTQTAGVSLTAQQPLNNIVRVAIQALAAVLGGTQSLHTNSFDEALALPTEEAVTVALRTQQIIAYETGVADTIDPLGGSYYVEWLTDKMEEETYKYFDQIERIGGVIAGIKKGFFQNEIAKASYKYQKEVEQGKRKIVGVNCYRTKQDDEVTIPVLIVDPEVERIQCERLKKLRETRDNSKVQKALRELEKQAKTENNLMPYLIDCAHAYATLGEIRETLVSVFGEYEPEDWF